MAEARYSILIPHGDEHGNKIPGVAAAAHHYLHHGPLKVTTTYVDPEKYNHTGPHDILHAYAEDSPEVDSHIKQLAAYVGDVVNHPAIYAFKHGKSGPKSWTIRNTQYQG